MFNCRREDGAPVSSSVLPWLRASSVPPVRHCLTIVVVTLLAAAALRAQSETGELRLKVTDPAGLGVQSSVEIISAENHLRLSIATGGAGNAVARRLPFGIYQVRLAPPGFVPFAETFEIRSALPTPLHIRLTLAAVNTSVVVKGADTLIDPYTAGTMRRIGSDTIRDRLNSLPGRSLVDLVNSEPGWLYEGSAVLHPRGSEYQTQFVVDGVPLTDNRSPAFGPEIEADDVRSMSIYTAGFPAEFGRKLGGVVDVSTAKDSRTGLHGETVAAGGSFNTGGGYGMAQYGWGRNTLSFSSEGSATRWYLNPVVPQDYTNRGTTSDFAVHYERDLSDRDRLGLIVRHEQADFEVPNEQVQESAGQRQNRNSKETLAIFSYQHIFSTQILGDFHAMLRRDTDGFWSNPLSTPIIAFQQRGFSEQYLKATATVRRGAQEWRAGVEADFTPLHEAFNDTITDFSQFDPGTPGWFAFQGRAHDYEQAAFVQDSVHLGHWSLMAGLRWDHYQLLLNQNAVSPRVSIGRYWKSANLALHFSYDRVFQTPAFENILLSSSPQVVSLDPDFLRVPVPPSHGAYYEAGFTKSLWGKFKLDGNYYRRYVNNYADDDLLLNTSVSFPIAFRKAEIYGVEAKLDLPAWGRLAGAASYSYQVGSAYFPATGGLFLGSEDINSDIHGTGRFWDSQDQRNTVRTRYRYALTKRAWVAAGAECGSGLPVEFEGSAEDALAQYGPAVVKRVNFAHGRVKPSLSVDASAGADLWKNERLALRLQADVQNLNNRLNVIDFAGLFSGNAIAPPRSGSVRLTAEF